MKNTKLSISLVIYDYPQNHTSSCLRTVLIIFLLSSCPVLGKDCTPKDCIASQWEEWSQCSHSCGDSGIRTRTRTLLQEAACGGKCEGWNRQEESCNRQCCPKNCVFTEWSGWSSCQCYANRCPGHGNWYLCYRFRDKESGSSCGGYCDNRNYELKCIRPCCYRDCILGGWLGWGECEARCESPGTRTRVRRRIQEPDCGGKRCEGGIEKSSCTGPCCPVDCVLGVWSEWSHCQAVCGQANVTRTRFITAPICGGAECAEKHTSETKMCEVYSNVDCKMGPWSEWTPCTLDNGSCGKGSKTRSRKVLIEPECRGQTCPNTTETSVCYGPCCRVDCQVGEWSEYGHCSTDCGTGFATRTRKVIVKPECGGTECGVLSQDQDCVMKSKTDCQFTQWSIWSDCNNDCGQGQQMRSRTLLSPAYCGGQCSNKDTEEKKDCESFSARTDCKVSEWSEWGECVRDCHTGSQSSSRTILENDQCGGVPCEGTYNLTRTRPCHEKCSQRCNQGVCSCDTGYTMQKNEYSCQKVNCGGDPDLSYCGPGTVPFESCGLVRFNCKNTLYGDTCDGTCTNDWILKGSPRFVTCQANGRWDEPKIFCGPNNLPPKDIDVTSTRVSESTKKGACFAKLSTETVGEDSWDSHEYSIRDDPSGFLKISGENICVNTVLDYETSKFREWNATIRSTDIDDLYLDKEFTFSLLDSNEPPRSATLSPNTLQENSPYGTPIGCFTLKDDDEGQTITMVMLTAEKEFKLYENDKNEYCLKVNVHSEVGCSEYGGKLCKLNYEAKKNYFIAVMVTDDADPAEEAYFEIKIGLTDINEPVTDLTVSRQNVVENAEPAEALMTLTAQDEDKDTEHRFEILKDPSGLFRVEGNKLYSSTPLDYEKNPQEEFTLDMKVTDPVEPVSSVEKSISFGIEDLNESPYQLVITSANSLEIFPTNKPKAKENIKDLRVGTVSVIDPDHGDSVDFSVNDTTFSITGKYCSSNRNGAYHYCSGQLIHKGIFDFEKIRTVPLLIKAEDRAKHDITLKIDIEIIDTDDPPTDILIDGNKTDSIQVPENAQGLQVAVLTAMDEDKDDSHTFFQSGQASRFFVIEGNVLKTVQRVALDYENYQPTNLTITAFDRADAPVLKEFKLFVTDVNEPPTMISFSSDKVKENSKEGTVIGIMSVDDPDNAAETMQSFSFELLDDSKGRFDIRNNQLLVKTSDKTCGKTLCILDFEGQRDLLIQVKVTDDGVPPQSKMISKEISVIDQNDNPYGLKISTNQVRENKIPGSVIGVLIAFDQDEGDTLTFTLKNHIDDFEIINGNQLIQKGTLDFETKKEYFIDVLVNDSNVPPGTMTGSIKIEVTDANEAPRFVGPNEYNVTENEAQGSVVTILSILDPDHPETVTLRLTNSQETFGIDNVSTNEQDGGGTLFKAELITKVSLDFEKWNAYSMGIGMTDSKGLEEVHQIAINIENSNDPPQNILLDGSSASEIILDEGKVMDVGELTSTDQDSQQSHTYTITAQPENFFTIKGKKLQLSKALDAETNPSFDITIETTDNGIPFRSFEKNFTVMVTNVNEPPIGLTLLNTKITENSPDGTEVGLLLPEDPDSTDGFDFVLLDNADGKFRIDGYKVVVVASSQCTPSTQSFCSLNFESQQSHNIKVMVTDQDNPPQSATYDLKIEVLNANDSPTDIKLTSSTVEELAPAGTIIGRLSVADEDLGQSHTFVIKESTGGAIKIADDRISLAKASHDRLKNSQVYSATVVATDNGLPPLSAEKTVYISVTGVSEVPKNLKLSALQGNTQVDNTHIKIKESSTLTAVASLSAEDNDLDQTISFSLLENPDEIFGLGNDTKCVKQTETVSCVVELVLKKKLNFEHKTKYILTALATDSGDGTFSQSFTIDVTDVSEAPTDITFNKDQLTVFENSQDLIVGRFTSVDEDRQDSHVFSLESGGNGAMTINPTGTLAIQKDAKIDYEATDSFDITVKVSDSSGNSFNKLFPVKVLDVNEKPTKLSISQSSIAEGSKANTVIGQLSTTDPDNERSDGKELQLFQYLLRDDAEGRFYLDGSSLLVSTKGAQCTESWCGLNFEKKSSHEIKVQATDSGTPALSDLFNLKITLDDKNDKPVLLDIDVPQLKEDMDVGQLVVLLSATDEDKDQELTFSIVDNGKSLFKVDGSKLLLNGKLDFEDAKSVSVTIAVTDNGSPPMSAQKKYTFNVINVEEKPSSIHFESVTGSQAESFPQDEPVIKENMRVGTLIGQMVVLDPDMDEYLTIIISGDEIVDESTGCLILTRGTRCVSSIVLERTLDYEKEKDFSVTVTAIDKTGKNLTRDFQIKVKDQNDSPQKILLNNEDINVLEVKENEMNQAIANMSVIDEDADQNFTIEVKGSSLFYMVGDELRIGAAAQLDFEKIKEIDLRIKATDNGIPSLSTEKEITIKILDVNEAPTKVSLTRYEIAEDSLVGSEIGNFITIDPDNRINLRQTFTYELTEDKDGLFQIVGSSLQVKKAALDYEDKAKHPIKVRVTDSGKPPMSLELELEILVMDRNDPPSNLQLSGFTVEENADINTPIGKLTAQDPDKDQIITFTIPNSYIVTVKGGNVVVKGEPDFETQPEFSFEVVASDDASPPKSISKTFKITVSDANEEPSKIIFTPMSASGELEIDERTKANEVIGVIKSYDVDSIDRVTFAMTSKSSEFFRLDDSEADCGNQFVTSMGAKYTVCSIKVLLVKQVHYKPLEPPMILEVSVTDKGKLTLKSKWEISVLDVNDPPYNITIKDNRHEVPENKRFFMLGAVECIDHDVEQKHIFQVLSHWDIFKVSTTSMLSVNKAFDAEKQSEYELSLQCIDSGKPEGKFKKTFLINVVDVNEDPTEIILSHDQVPMTAKDGETIALVSVKDPDNEGTDPTKQKHHCNLTKDASQSFTLNDERKTLEVKGSLPVHNESVSITIHCSDDGTPPLSITSIFKLLITETADVPKEIILKGSKEIVENSKNVEVGTLAITNQLTGNEIQGNFVYENLKISEASDDVLSVRGNKLYVDKAIDFEKLPSLSGTVEANGKDAKENDVKVSGKFELRVLDVNESPTQILIYGGGVVKENLPEGTIIGKLNTVDPEPDQQYTYEIFSVAFGLDISKADPDLLDAIVLEGETLKTGPKHKMLDFETDQTLSAVIQTTDSGSPSHSLNYTVRIVVQDANDAPTNISLDSYLIKENSPLKTRIGKLIVEDADKDQPHHCIVNNLQDIPFNVENSLDLVVSKDELNYEAQRTYVVDLTCEDEGKEGNHLKVTKALTVTVVDENEPPYNISLSKLEVKEGNTVGDFIAQISATDPDSKEVFFAIDGENSNFFIRGSNSLVAGFVSDFEKQSSHSFSINARDDGGLSTTQEFTIQVTDKNEKPSSITLSKQVVMENAKRGSLVGILRTEDPDQKQMFTYTLSDKSSASGQFLILGDRLEVGEGKLDFEASNSHRISITSQDNGQPPQSLTVDFDITVSDVNEAPSEIIIKEPVTVEENTRPQTILGEITVEDEEPKQAHFCSIITPQAPFSITTSINGVIQLIVRDTINFESKPSYDLNISCSDGEFDVYKALRVQVMNVNEAPTNIILKGPQALPAVISGKYEVGRLIAVDEDNGQDHIFTITGANSDLFKIEDGNRLIQRENIPSDILALPAPELNITLTVIDTGLSFRQILTLPISDEDLQTLKLPKLTSSTEEIMEDAVLGDVVAEISEQVNKSLANHITFTITDDPNAVFSMKENKLILTKDISSVTLNSVDIRIQAQSKMTQEVKEKTFTYFIKRSDLCYNNGQTCHDDARCVKVNASSHACKCNADFQGSGYTCQQVDNCIGNENKCGLHGQCVDDVKSFKCKCQKGYSGPSCEIGPPVNDSCTGNKCQNQAVCKPDDSKEGYRCSCPPGWTGKMCETNVDECKDEVNICGAEGVCIDEHLTYSCSCSKTRFGHRCQFYKDTCKGKSCGNGAVCIPKYKEFDSTCSPANYSVTLKVKCEKGDNVQKCTDRFLQFVEKNGLFTVSNSPQASFSVFSSISQDGPSGFLLTTFFILNVANEPISERDILDGLYKTCKSIESSQQSETYYCPTIMDAYLKYRFRFTTMANQVTANSGDTEDTTDSQPIVVTPEDKATSALGDRLVIVLLFFITTVFKYLLM